MASLQEVRSQLAELEGRISSIGTSVARLRSEIDTVAARNEDIEIDVTIDAQVDTLGRTQRAFDATLLELQSVIFRALADARKGG